MKKIIIIFLIIPLSAIANQDILLNIDKFIVDSVIELSEYQYLKQKKCSILKQ